MQFFIAWIKDKPLYENDEERTRSLSLILNYEKEVPYTLIAYIYFVWRMKKESAKYIYLYRESHHHDRLYKQNEPCPASYE